MLAAGREYAKSRAAGPVALFAGAISAGIFRPRYPSSDMIAPALSRSWVLLVNRAGRSQPVSLYYNTLGHSSPSQIGSEVGYSWPM